MAKRNRQFKLYKDRIKDEVWLRGYREGYRDGLEEIKKSTGQLSDEAHAAILREINPDGQEF